MPLDPPHTDDRRERPARTRKALRPALWAAFAWIGGLLVGFGYGLPLSLLTGLAALLLVLTGVSWAYARRRSAHAGSAPLVALLLAIGALGAIRAGIWERTQLDPASIAPLVGNRVLLVGSVASDPQISGRRWRFGVEADSIGSDSALAVGRMRVFVRADTAVGVARIGERMRLVGTLRALPYATAPGLFDYGAYLERRGYVATLSVHEEGGLTVLPARRSAWVSFWDATRRYVRRTITDRLKPAHAGLITGLVLGDRSGLSKEVLSEFQACGVVHVLSVSGLHVGIILLGAGWPLRRMFGWRVWQVPLLVLLAWGYAALTGGNPPVVRSSIMATVILLSLIVSRQPDLWNALALSALLTLAVSPAAIFEASFQLSYAAMIGLLWFADLFQKHAGRVRFFRRNQAWQYLAGLVGATVAAQLTTWPVVAHYFARVPLFGVAANPVIVTLVTLSVWGAMAASAFGWIPGLASAVNVPVSWLLAGVLRTGEWFASLPGAAAWVRPPTWAEVFAYALVLWLVWQVGRRRGAFKGVLAAVLLFGNLWIWSAWAHRRTAVECTFLDVGQGDAAVCAFPNGATLLIDGGPASPWFDAGDWVIVPYFRSRGISRVDVVIATHSDNDHVGGLASVLRTLDVGQLWYHGRSDTAAAFRRLMSIAAERGVPVRRVAAGDSVVGLGDARALVLSPPKDSLALVWWSENDFSVVLWMEAYGQAVLFTGDAGFVAEDRLLRTWGGDRLRARVLKVAHHGSAYATSDAFLAAVGPAWGVVSVGRGNRYGHPASALLERLRAHGVVPLRTDRAGTVTWCVKSDTSYWRGMFLAPDRATGNGGP